MALGPFQVAQKLSEGKRERGVALLMRHGETAWNREGRVMGRQPVELDEAGRAQVALAVPLARLLAPDLIVASPLPRAVQSAEIIARGVGGLGIAWVRFNPRGHLVRLDDRDLLDFFAQNLGQYPRNVPLE